MSNRCPTGACLRSVLTFTAAIGFLVSFPGGIAAQTAASRLHLETVGSDSSSFDVVATMVVGPTEVLLWDAQYHLADARRLADRIAASGKRLKAIIVSHPDHDHYAGAAAIVERFPGTPVYMTAAALAQFRATAAQGFAQERSRRPDLLPDSLVTPQVLPSLRMMVDGEVVEIIPDLAGDVLEPTNSMLWIPSLSAVLAADVVFQNVHPWLGASSSATRAAWKATLSRMAALKPAIVVAGQKKDVAAPDSPGVVQEMIRYIDDFEALAKTSENADMLFQRMVAKYPDYAVSGLLRFSAMRAIQQKAAAVPAARPVAQAHRKL
jgi:glyoxylase-like metal-dependent hydrolase (beta-lactamase superfamily II)